MASSIWSSAFRSYDPPDELFGLTVDSKPRKLASGALKTKSWFGPNSQYFRELPCPSCRGRVILHSLNAKTGLYSNRMEIIHSNPLLCAQRVAAIKIDSSQVIYVARRYITEEHGGSKNRMNDEGQSQKNITVVYVDRLGTVAGLAPKLRWKKSVLLLQARILLPLGGVTPAACA
ncbi:hypothetical protein ACH5RR_035785 [Cinchona calisaya]|uniref:Uncharacterized protein n=1 Tax=Cinchona calisaya TaxID=153742 RepID=A0ABD2Y199_9GENT